MMWRWALEQLPEDVVVLPQVAMTVGRGGRAEEAEADLVILDPSFGIVIVEVKGGTLWYDGTRAAWRRRESGGHVVRDPVAQAKRARSILRNSLRAARVDIDELALRWAVGMPDARVEAPGEPVLDQAYLWDALSVDRLLQAYRRTCGRHEEGERPPGDELIEFIAQTLRGRTREARPALRSDVEQHEERVRVLTESHRNVLHHFAAHKRVLVRGSAGTGKTLLAVLAAAQLAALGERVLLACWNIVLAGGLREAVRAELQAVGSPRAEEVTDDPAGGIVVGHLVGLARHARPDTPASVGTTYFQEELPAALTTEVTGGQFDAIVLDEAQDLSDVWMFALDDLLTPGGRWYAFADRHQDIFASEASLKDFLELEHELRENFRNTRHIAEFAAQFGPTELDCINADGPPVRFVATASDDVIERTVVEAGRLQRDERIPDNHLAVLWLFNNPMRGRNDELAEEAAAGQLVRTNSATFKGIERPVVVLGLDLDPAKADRGEEAGRTIYVAATRARSHLTVVGDPDVAQAYGFADLADQLRASARQRRRI
jgi:hypothetical protein